MKIGIPVLDDKIGEIPKNSSVLVSTLPGIDPTPFGLSILGSAIKEKLSIVYIANNKPGHAVRKEAAALGINISSHEKAGTVSILDAFSNYMGMDSEERYVVHDPFSSKDILATITCALGKKRSALVIFDSISSYIDMGGETEKILDAIKKIKSYGTVIALFSEWKYDPKVITKIKHAFDAVFTVKPVEEFAILRLFLVPEKIKWKKLEKFTVPIRVIKPGGVKVYFPKILVTGPYQAGKTSLVKAISAASISTDRLGTTVAIDHGYLDYKGFTADIYGTPGQETFDPLLEYIASDAVGVILVIDSTEPKSFIRAKEMLSKTKSYGLPIVVAANKQDMTSALKIEQIRKTLSLGMDVPICPTVAVTKKGVTKLLDTLINRLIG